MSTKIITHRTKINPELLQHGEAGFVENLGNFKVGTTPDTLPAGRLLGIYFLSYVKPLDAWSAIDYKKADAPEEADPKDKAFVCSHTNIEIKDSFSNEITRPTDIQDYDRKNWNDKGYKEVDFEIAANLKVLIEFEAMGDAYPPCGEFVFVIEQNITC